MADEATINDDTSKRKMVIIIAAALISILLIIAIIVGTMFFTGYFNEEEDIIQQLNEIQTPEQQLAATSANSLNVPNLMELPDNNRLDTLYHQFAQPFTVNVSNSRKVMQLGLTLSTHYDDRVIDNLMKHELAVRSAVLEHLSYVTEDDTLSVGFRGKVGEELAIVINAELEKVEGFGGIERVLFTEFLMQ